MTNLPLRFVSFLFACLVFTSNAIAQTFQLGPGQEFLVGEFSRLADACVADIDADGDDDVIISGRTLASIYWLENNGLALQSPAVLLETSFPEALVVRDFDSDGRLDIVVGGVTGQKLFLNQGSSSLGIPEFGSAVSLTNLETGSGVTRDFDGDGLADSVTILEDLGQIVVFWGTSDGNYFSAPVVIDSPFASFARFSAGDIDGDGRTDLIASLQSLESELVWYRNEGQRSFAEPVTIFSSFGFLNFNSLRDLDQDGDLDVIIGYYDDWNYEGGVEWYENTPQTRNEDWEWPAHNISDIIGYSQDHSHIDVDGDAHLDIIIPYSGSGRLMWFEAEGGVKNTWTARELDSDYTGAWVIYEADFNNNGLSDLFVSSFTSTDLRIYEDFGTPAQPVGTSLLSVPLIQEIVPFDVNQDGFFDVVASTSSGQTIAYLGEEVSISDPVNIDLEQVPGFPGFSENNLFETKIDNILTDLNGDEILDNVFLDSDQSLKWRLGLESGLGLASTLPFSQVNIVVYNLSIFDFDGDGDEEITAVVGPTSHDNGAIILGARLLVFEGTPVDGYNLANDFDLNFESARSEITFVDPADPVNGSLFSLSEMFESYYFQERTNLNASWVYVNGSSLPELFLSYSYDIVDDFFTYWGERSALFQVSGLNGAAEPAVDLVSNSYHSLAFGDLDGNGAVDIATISDGPTRDILLQYGDGQSFLAPVKAGEAKPHFFRADLNLADLNGDGFLDVSYIASDRQAIVVHYLIRNEEKFEISKISRSPEGFVTLEFPVRTGYQYQVFSTNVLSSSEWTPTGIPLVIFEDEENYLWNSATIVAEDVKFFRVERIAQD